MAIIMGTAGHIDHGKTSLIRALTGIDCDRLEEEKRRGITIELGFAFLDLDENRRLGIVDVPGHERFVKNMVAGAAGIDFVLLAIAADEGVMPQTREHLEICSLLGTTRGIVALTKTDMVDEEWLELVTEDVTNFLAGTFLEGAPIMPVSSQTGQGIDALKSELGKLADSLTGRKGTDLLRLPVDRVFTMKGYGTVVTGTLISGRLAVGDDVWLYPGETATKVRNIQSHGEASEVSETGRRTAVNLQGLEVEDVTRGDVLAHPRTLFPSQVWDVELTLLASSPRSLKHRKEVHFHHGSRETLARVYFLDRDELKPGDTAACQVRFSEPMAGVYGDRVVLRSFSPLRTIGGGKLVNPLGRKVKRFSDEVKRLETLAKGDDAELATTQLNLAGSEGLTFAALRVLVNLDVKALEKLLNDLSGRQALFMFDRESRAYVSGEVAEELSSGLTAHLARFHEKSPTKLGASRGEIASTWGRKLPPKLMHFLIERMVKKGDIVSEQDIFRLPEHEISLASDQSQLKENILQAYKKGGITPPNLRDVLDPLGVTFAQAQDVFRLLTEQGDLVKVKEEMFFAAESIARITAMVTDWLKENQEMGPAEFRDVTGLSRKFAIPLLEYLDKAKITVRVGDKRRLRKI